MKRLALEFIVIPLVFFLLWFSISRIDFVRHFKIREKVEVNEKRIGDLLIEVFVKSEEEYLNSEIVEPINRIKNKICNCNQIVGDSIKIRIFKKDEVNAFALPNKTIVIYSGLIENCKNPEELGSIIAHELAHIEKNHVIKKLVKEVGLSMLSSYVGGNNSGEALKELMKKATSTAYDRKLEDEADIIATSYLIKSKINPSHYADFLIRISEKTDISSILVFINTHPNSKDRASKILRDEIKIFEEEKLLSKEDWELIQNLL